MCEIFGNYGWKEGVRLEKYLLDHFMVRGVNYFVPHAFTCSAYPEKDCPPHFYAQGNNPQYRHFGELMKYANRVTGMISGGKAAVPVAVLYHAEAEWCGNAMLVQKPARVLLDNQIDFHIVPADVFAEQDFYNTEITEALTVNGNRYQALVIPYARFITRETAQAVETLVQGGGKVLFIDALPDGLCTGEDLPDSLQNCQSITLPQLAAELDSLRTIGLAPSNNRIRAMHYIGEREFYYLFNEGELTYSGTVNLPAGEYYRYDAWHDRCEVLEAQDGQLSISVAPSQSCFIMCGPAPASVYTPAPRGEKILLMRFAQSVCRGVNYPNFSSATEISVLESYALTDKKFSGIIRYDAAFDYPAKTLEITDAYEGVEVFLNGQSLGIQVTAPFVYDLRDRTKNGNNHLTIEVATTLERENGNGKDAAPTGIVGDVALYL